MEGVSAGVCRGIKRYLRRKDYERLKKKDGGRRRSIKLTRRLKLNKLGFSISPKKLLLGLRDAYVRMMMSVANSNSGGSYGFGMGPINIIKEYDDPVIVHIYRSVVKAQAQQVYCLH